MSERKGSGLFYGLFMVAAAMAVVVIATFISTLAHAGSESENDRGQSAQRKTVAMTCKDGSYEFGASIALTMSEDGQPIAGAITTEKTGTCFAGRPASAIGAFGGKIDMHDFMTRAGETCVNDTSFAVFVEKSTDLIRHASLQIGEHVYPCARD